MSLYLNLQKIDISKVVINLVDQLLPKGTYNKIMCINLIVDVECYNTNHHISKFIQILIYNPRNYVFIGEPVKHIKYDNDLIEGSEIIYHGYHDSCWRDSIETLIKNKVKEITQIIKDKKGDESKYFSNVNFSFDPVMFYNGNINIKQPNEMSTFTTKNISEYPKEILVLTKNLNTPLYNYKVGEEKLSTEWSDVLGFKSYNDFFKKFKSDNDFSSWFNFK